ncbi:MAG TPA: hypothetical protein VF821_18440 [Lentzea sp.]
MSPELREATGAPHKSMRLVVRSDLSLAEATTRLLSGIEARWPGEVPHPAEFAVSATPCGPGMWINGHDRADLASVLHQLTEALDVAGFSDATLDHLVETSPELVSAPRPTPFAECRFTVRLGADGAVADADRHAAVDDAARWCLSLPGTVFMLAGMLSTTVSRPRAAEVLAVNGLAETTGSTGLVRPMSRLVVEGNGIFRMATLSFRSGYLSVAEGTTQPADFDWRRSVDAVTSALRDVGDWATSGFVKRGGAWSSTADRTFTDWPPPPRPIPRRGRLQRDLEQHGLLDAFGVMLRGATDAPLPSDGRWQAEPVGDRVFVRHSDPAAWYAETTPNEATLAEAREQLGPLFAP